MYTHDRSRRRKGVNVAEIVAGVLGVILLILLIGAFSSQTPRRRDDRRVPKNHAAILPDFVLHADPPPSARSEPKSVQRQGDADAPA
jgi:hypothetical protein